MPFDFESHAWLAGLAIIPALLIVLRHTLIDSSRIQLWITAAVRAITIALIVLALANTLFMGKSQHVAVLVLADLSDSAPQKGVDQASAILRQVADRAANPGQAGLITFSNEATTVVPVQPKPVFPEKLQKPEARGDTAIAGALQRAREIMPTGTINRVLLISDGNETTGNAMETAKLCATHGIRIYTMPYQSDEKDEVLLEDLIVPAEVKRGQSFSVSARAHSTVEGQAAFTLYRNGFKVQEKQLDLKKGENELVFDETNPTDGLTKYELRVTTEKDFFADNNVASGIVFVAGQPRVLLLEGQENEARYLARALEAEDVAVEVREGKGMPGSLDELAAFDAVILSDVPATDVNVRQMNLLRSYVEDLGGGMIMIGGEESFALGGYYRTAIEDALPVRMRSEKKKDTPSLAMMLVVDKSGSMDGEKIELAKEAGIAAVELLGPQDQVGVVAFDGEPYWVVELQSADNKTGIIQTISTIEAGGGTSIYPGLVEAHTALSLAPAAFKHVVLLTDGQSQPGDFQGIVDQMTSEQMTVSTVAVGDGADTVLLQDIARWGNGRYYFTADPYDIPQIFTKETMSASKSSLIEEPFLPQIFQQDQMVQGIDWDSSPFLFGYVVTTAKSTAKVTLATERGDPLLAGWRFGLGKTAAFTSDAKSRWASDWLGWPGYGKFWAQVVRDVMRTTSSLGAQTDIAIRPDRAEVSVDNFDDDGNFVNNLTTTAQIIKPDLSVAELPLDQRGPGRYETDVPISETGSYLLKLRQTRMVTNETGEQEEQVVSDFTRGITVSYKPEYRHLSTNESFLRQLAEVTGGTYNPTVEEVFRVAPEEAVVVRRRIAPWLLLAAVMIFVLDVALRRFDLAGLRLFGPPQRYG
ncbi:MAG: hypothetical protein AMXMBFR84_28130 [Candidatus Hydrogenedentota bacterium]